jgi:uncharacterized protein YbjT (DUF2867 family)
VAAERLLDAGESVRVIGRSADRLQPLVARGAEAAVGDMGDAAFLTRAFAGADAVYLMVPPDYQDVDPRARYARAGDVFTQAITASGVTRAVFLSSVGAELASGTGPIVGPHQMERQLETLSGVNLLFLRPAYFYENHLPTLGLIKHQGINGGLFEPDLPIQAVATVDIGVAAADALRARAFSGIVVQELSGPRDLSARETTRIIGEAIGKPDLPYVPFSVEDQIKGMVGAGLSQALAEAFVEMIQGLNNGLIHLNAPRTPATTGTTTFEAFVQRAVVPAYQAL